MWSKNKISWLPLYLALLAIALTSSFSVNDYSFYDQKRIAQGFVLVLSSFFFLFYIYKYEVTGFVKPVKAALALLLALLVASSLFAPIQRWAFLELGWYIFLFALMLINVHLYLYDKKHFLKVLSLGIVALCVIYSSRVYADYIIGIFLDYWTVWPNQRRFKIMYEGVNLFPSGFLGFSNYRFFNHLQTWSLPLLVFVYQYYRKTLISGLRYLLLFFISSWWMLVFASDARGTMLASVCSLIFVGLLYKKKVYEFFKIYGITALTGLALYFVLFLYPASGGKEILTRFHDSGRFEVWMLAFNRILDNPLLGLGPMHFNFVPNNPLMKAPHNIILQFAAEWGIPALFLFAGLTLGGFYFFVKQSLDLATNETKSDDINLRIALIASLTAALVHALFSGIYNTPLSQLLGTVVIGAILGEYFFASGMSLFQEREERTIALYVLITFLFINTAFISIQAGSDIPNLKEREQKYLEKFRSNPEKFNRLGFYPRFWNQGLIYEGEEGKLEKGRLDQEDSDFND